MARPPRSDTPAAGAGRLSEVADLIRMTVPPPHRSGWPFIGAGLAITLAGYRWGRLRRMGLLVAAAGTGFFRQPRRVVPSRAGIAVAPADGVVCAVDTADLPPELGRSDARVQRISIFMSIFDAHVQRAPVGGEVLAVHHRKGSFAAANLDAASEQNERNSVVIRTADGTEVTVVQVAGLVARRIVCDVRAGDRVAMGEVYGIIRFGSRLDTYLPAGSRPAVEVGQRAVAGETVLAELPGAS